MILIPTKGPNDWRGLLAEPEKQWRQGYSACTLANCWEATTGVPPEVGALFPVPPELLLAIPEHKVPLPGGRAESQNDVFALIRVGAKTIAVTVEGKVEESFDKTMSKWLSPETKGKRARLDALCELLGLSSDPPDSIYYQLLHRTASAVIEARRFGCDDAAMIVHSFSPTKRWFEAFQEFAALFGVDAEPDRLFTTRLPNGMHLHLAWASGDLRFLESD